MTAPPGRRCGSGIRWRRRGRATHRHPSRCERSRGASSAAPRHAGRVRSECESPKHLQQGPAGDATAVASGEEPGREPLNLSIIYLGPSVHIWRGSWADSAGDGEPSICALRSLIKRPTPVLTVTPPAPLPMCTVLRCVQAQTSPCNWRSHLQRSHAGRRCCR